MSKHLFFAILLERPWKKLATTQIDSFFEPLKIQVIIVGRLALLAGPAKLVKMSQINLSKLHQTS